MRDPLVPSALDCMHCGFCLQVCPTYLETGDENESPRGRLFLMRAVDENRLELDATVAAHLDHCLDCRACETACPSGVEYSRVLEPFRVRQRIARPQDAPASQRGLAGKIQREALPDRDRLRRWLAPARLGQRLGLGKLAHALKLQYALPAPLRRMTEQLPPPPPKLKPLPELLRPATTPRSSPTAAAAPRVGLLLGCASEVFTPQVNRAAAVVLQALGCEVHIPATQGCCGALAYHEGRAAAATENWQALAKVFGTADAPEHLISTAAGCGSMLHDLQRVAAELALDDPDIMRMGKRAVDFHRYVAGLEWPEQLQAVPLRAVYDPACHLVHAQGVRDEPLQLLARVPGLELLAYDEAEVCCGAAGSYVLSQPEMSDSIGLRKARHILASGAEAVITANVGCAMQIQRCVRKLGHDLAIFHPAEILAKALGLPAEPR
jgi:glycolate dehydrogenase iron-sulfur subunit